jgi:type I restriction enzyme, S subunit
MNKEMMQDSGIEWIGAIPPGWTVIRLKKVTTIKSSNVDKKDYPAQIPVRLCNYVDVYYNDVIDSSIKFMKSTASELEYKKFHLSVGDVVLTKDSETPDDIAIPAYVAENIDDLVCGYHLAVMQANHKLDGKFLFRAIQSTGIKE